MKRSLLLFLALFAFVSYTFTSNSMAKEEPMKNQTVKTLGVLVFPDFELLDLFGPLEMFGNLPDDIKIVLVSEKGGLVASAQGPEIMTDTTLNEAPPIDLLLIPGGMGTRKEVNNPKLIAWIKERSDKASMTLSVCTGAALLAKAGVLDGKRATTNKLAFNWVVEQGPKVKWVKEARWVEDGNMVSSSGVAAGTDMSLYVISELYGKKTADSIINTTEYIWNSDPHKDPFAKNIPPVKK